MTGTCRYDHRHSKPEAVTAKSKGENGLCEKRLCALVRTFQERTRPLDENYTPPKPIIVTEERHHEKRSRRLTSR